MGIKQCVWVGSRCLENPRGTILVSPNAKWSLVEKIKGISFMLRKHRHTDWQTGTERQDYSTKTSLSAYLTVAAMKIDRPSFRTCICLPIDSGQNNSHKIQTWRRIRETCPFVPGGLDLPWTPNGHCRHMMSSWWVRMYFKNYTMFVCCKRELLYQN